MFKKQSEKAHVVNVPRTQNPQNAARNDNDDDGDDDNDYANED